MEFLLGIISGCIFCKFINPILESLLEILFVKIEIMIKYYDTLAAYEADAKSAFESQVSLIGADNAIKYDGRNVVVDIRSAKTGAGRHTRPTLHQRGYLQLVVIPEQLRGGRCGAHRRRPSVIPRTDSHNVSDHERPGHVGYLPMEAHRLHP